MCYCAKIKEMMKESKESGKAVVIAFDGGALFVEYSEHYDEFTFQYTWNINEDEHTLKQEVRQELSKYTTNDLKEFDLIQIGLVTVYNTNEEYLCKAIEKAKNNELEPQRDSKYVFMGNKVLRVVQYFGMYSNPFDCSEIMKKWNQQLNDGFAKNRGVSKVMNGLEYYHNKDNNTIVFTFGAAENKVTFAEKIVDGIPPLLQIDNVTENILYDIPN